jgi:peptidoglycan/LPS O-acetylase OafA/YrhL
LSPGIPLFEYRPHLDGLRCVAVLLVILFHTGASGFAGGFIGVDVFFVLSGYLITSVLLNKHVGSHRAGLSTFYARRIRRLLPAAVLTLVVTLAWYQAVASPLEVRQQGGAFTSAMVYVSNWWFIGRGLDYFGSEMSVSPVLHFWSLSIEEQFYALWPLIVLLLTAKIIQVSRRSAESRVAVFAGMGVLASVALALTDPSGLRSYYGTDTRIYQLMVGALLAAVIPRLRLSRHLRYLGIVGIAAMVAVASSAMDIAPIHRGVLAAGATAMAILGFEAASSVTRNLLAAPAPVWMGKVSYGVYLWHWPVTLELGRGLGLTGWPLTGAVTVIATIIAGISFHAMEMPIRRSATLGRHPRAVIAVGVVVSVVMAATVALVPTSISSQTALAESSEATQAPLSLETPEGLLATSTTISDDGPVPAPATTQDLRPPLDDIDPPITLDWAEASTDWMPGSRCMDEPAEQCLVVAGGGARVLFFGDSHAWAWLPALTAIAEVRGWDFYAFITPRCPWLDGLTVENEARYVTRCDAHQQFIRDQLMPSISPDVIIVASVQLVDRNLIRMETGTVLEAGTEAHRAAMEDGARRTVALSLGVADQVWILEPIPIASREESVPECLSRGDVEACAFEPIYDQTPQEEIYRELATDPRVVSIDMDLFVCPRLPICDAIVDGFITRKDSHHLTATFSRHLAAALNRALPYPP